jgi:hypothetical protein
MGRNNVRGVSGVPLLPPPDKQEVDLGGITLVVTGYPRSGTSLMMRMLHFGGIGVRVADNSKGIANERVQFNPYGSMELNDVLNDIKMQPVHWTHNHAVKVVSVYFDCLPIDRPLKAIFMIRDSGEIIASLMAMKVVWNATIEDANQMMRGYLQHMKVPTLFVNYKEAMQYPKSTATRIADFLDADLNIDGMVKAVDPDVRKRYLEDRSIRKQKDSGIINVDVEGFKANSETVAMASVNTINDYHSGNLSPEEAEGLRAALEHGKEVMKNV